MPAATEQKTKLQKYAIAAPVAPAKVDAAAGILRDVALMSTGPAEGHGTEVDAKTLTLLFALAQGKSVKAFSNHSWNPDPAAVIGLFSGIYLDQSNPAATVLRATQFTALKSFREHNQAAFDTLFELAAVAPETFGVSLSLYCDHAWVLKDGTEILTDGFCFGAPPANAAGNTPVIRPNAIDSADFVSSPAANSSLFSKTGLDASGKRIQKTDTTSAHPAPKESEPKKKFSMLASTIYKKFSKNERALAKAVKFAAENPDATDDDVIDNVEDELDTENQEALAKENTDLKAQVADLQKQLADATEKDGNDDDDDDDDDDSDEDDDEGAGKGKPGKKESPKEELSRLKGELSAVKEQLAAVNKRRGYGHAPVNTGKPDSGVPKVGTKTTTEFYAMSHKDRMEFSVNGGRIVDPK